MAVLELVRPRQARSSGRTVSLLAVLAALTVCWCWIVTASSADAATPVVKEGYVPVGDGVDLRYSAWLPSASGRFPVVVVYGPYSEGSRPDAPSPGSGSTLSNATEQTLLDRGYAVVGVSVRGTGCSGGTFDLLAPQLWRDGYTAIESLAAQPWSSGHVGMWGISFSGITQLGTAAEHPPHLDALAPWHTLASVYRDVGYPGGMLNRVFAALWGFALQPSTSYETALQHALVTNDAECLQNLAEHAATGINGAPTWFTAGYLHKYMDSYWADRSPGRSPETIATPSFHCDAWEDDEAQPVTLATDYLPRLDPKLAWITMMNGWHGACGQGGDNAVIGKLVRFYDYFLKGENNGFERDQPHVQLWHDTRGNANGTPTATWITTARSWNTIGHQPVNLYFRGGGLSEAPPATAEAVNSYVYPLPAPAMDASFVNHGHDDGVWAAPLVPGSAVSYTTPKLAHDTEFFGTGSVDLWLSSTASDTDLQATVTEVRPDGKEVYVQRGWLRASQRKLDDSLSTRLAPIHTHRQEDVQNLTPGQPTFMRLLMDPFDHVFRAGSSVRLWIDAPTSLTGNWSLDFSPVPGTNTILHDAQHPSRIALGYLPAGNAHGTPLPPCDLLNQPCRDNSKPVPPGTLDLPRQAVAPQSSARCGSGALLRFTIAQNHGRAIHVRVYVDGRKRLDRSGHRIRQVTVARPRGAQEQVRIVVDTATHLHVTSSRDFHNGCPSGKPATRVSRKKSG